MVVDLFVKYYDGLKYKKMTISCKVELQIGVSSLMTSKQKKYGEILGEITF